MAVKRYEYLPTSLGLMDPAGFPALISVKTDVVFARDYDALETAFRALRKAAGETWHAGRSEFPRGEIWDLDNLEDAIGAADLALGSTSDAAEKP